jgi:hypothetical protein
MAEQQKKTDQKPTEKKGKAPPTPRQVEIKRLIDKGSAARTEQESARLDQLKEEEKRDRFLRLAAPRVQRALHALVNVARLGNKQNYHYREDEAEKILTAISDAVDDVARAFTPGEKVKKSFTL